MAMYTEMCATIRDLLGRCAFVFLVLFPMALFSQALIRSQSPLIIKSQGTETDITNLSKSVLTEFWKNVNLGDTSKVLGALSNTEAEFIPDGSAVFGLGNKLYTKKQNEGSSGYASALVKSLQGKSPVPQLSSFVISGITSNPILTALHPLHTGGPYFNRTNTIWTVQYTLAYKNKRKQDVTCGCKCNFVADFQQAFSPPSAIFLSYVGSTQDPFPS